MGITELHIKRILYAKTQFDGAKRDYFFINGKK